MQLHEFPAALQNGLTVCKSFGIPPLVRTTGVCSGSGGMVGIILPFLFSGKSSLTPGISDPVWREKSAEIGCFYTGLLDFKSP